MKPLIRLNIHKDAQELGINNPVACILNNIEIIENSDALNDEIQSLEGVIGEEGQNILSKSEVRGFTEIFEKLGYQKQTPAGHRIVESFLTRGFKTYNNVIDAYNIASLLFGSGLGLHDALKVNGAVHVFRTKGNETIVPLFKKTLSKVKSNDLAYSNNKHLLAWLGKRDVDSDEYKVNPDSTSLLLIALGNGKTSEQYNRQACLKTIDLLKITCPEIRADFLQVEKE